jgi:hypothetical protein
LDELALDGEFADPWLGTELALDDGLGSEWNTGVLTGLGLGELTCETLALEAALDDALGAGVGGGGGGGAGVLTATLGAGLGGGALGALAVCCAKSVDVNNRTAAAERPESRIKHLVPTVEIEALGVASFTWTLPSAKRILRNRVKERNNSVRNRFPL